MCLVLQNSALSGADVGPEQIFLKDYKPRSIYKIPQTRIEKARFSAIDVHSHDYGRTKEEVERWVQTMDAVGLEKTIILSGATGKKFDDAVARYGTFSNRFTVWCGIDYTELDQPGFGPAAVAELERCRQAHGKKRKSPPAGIRSPLKILGPQVR